MMELQGDVLRRIVEAEIGVGVSKEVSGEELYKAIVEVRDNPLYQQNIDKLSTVFRDKRKVFHSCRTQRVIKRYFISELILRTLQLT